jgi:hypothetical protein
MGKGSRNRAKKKTQRKDDSVFLRDLAECRRFLVASASAYDHGYAGEVTRLAVMLRVLLHDVPEGRSLLGMLRMRDRMKYSDTAVPIFPGGTLPDPGLAMAQFGPGGAASDVPPPERLQPPGINPPAEFSAWWNNDVAEDDDGHLWSRRSLVLALADRGGSARVDPLLTESYEALVNRNGLRFRAAAPDGEQPLAGSLAAAAVRQVAYEILDTLAKHDLTWAVSWGPVDD